MATITIPKEVMKDGFVVLPRQEYERLLNVKQGDNLAVKRSVSFKVPKKHEKFYDELDKELTQTIREVNDGKCYGPFNTGVEAIKFLNSRRKTAKN